MQHSSDVDILEVKIAYAGHYKVNLYRLRHRLHDGGWSDEISREVFERGHAVAVLLYDPLEDAVVLLKQFRIGAYVGGLSPWQTEVVAGLIEEGESAEAVARRETEEEAGCQILDLVPVYRFLPSAGAVSETVALYCGRVNSRGLEGIRGLQDEHEDILVEVIQFDEAQELLRSGRIDNAIAIVALQWLALNRGSLRQRWLAASGGG